MITILFKHDKNIILKIFELSKHFIPILSLVCKEWLKFIKFMKLNRSCDEILRSGDIKMYQIAKGDAQIPLNKAYLMHPLFLTFLKDHICDDNAFYSCLEHGNLHNAQQIIDLGYIPRVNDGLINTIIKIKDYSCFHLILNQFKDTIEIMRICIEKAFEKKDVKIIDSLWSFYDRYQYENGTYRILDDEIDKLFAYRSLLHLEDNDILALSNKNHGNAIGKLLFEILGKEERDRDYNTKLTEFRKRFPTIEKRRIFIDSFIGIGYLACDDYDSSDEE